MRPRALISDSWARFRRHGVDPDRGTDARPISTEQLEQRRWESGLADVLPVLRDGLVTVADEAHIMVVVDAAGRVLWRDGCSSVRRRADGLGFVEGAAWDENTVGTNAIGTALVVRKPVQVYSAEHFVRTHHAWTCSSSPVFDPRGGRLLGVIDVSGPAPGIHPSTLALVHAVAKLAETQLRGAHQAELERLRTIA
ncbi:MAG TPA: GAF domain-containing protein, partial [Actinomycetes bacterium]|nr:GAF domain-containing protein [Actinomycetes bacterium]